MDDAKVEQEVGQLLFLVTIFLLVLLMELFSSAVLFGICVY